MSALGYILRFPENSRLRGVVFLEPSWVARILGDLFSHTLEAKGDSDLEDLIERGLLRESTIPKLPKLRARGGSVNSGHLLSLLTPLKLGYPKPESGSLGGGGQTYYLPGRWPEGRPDAVAAKWAPQAGDLVRGWRLTSRGRLPAGFFETALVQSGICVAFPPKASDQWQGGVLIEAPRSVSILVESRRDADGGSCLDMLAKVGQKEAAQLVQDGSGDEDLWGPLSSIVLSAFSLHRVAFHGDHRIEYLAVCPLHQPGHFLRLTPSVLGELVQGRHAGMLRGDCQSVGNPSTSPHNDVPWAQIAPSPERLREAFRQEEVLAALRRIDQMQRGFPLLIEQAQHALGALIVAAKTDVAPRVFIVHREGLDKARALEGMRAVIKEAVDAGLAASSADSAVEVGARKFLAVAYNRLMGGLFQDHARLFLVCEECGEPQGSGYAIRRKSKWGNRLASALGVLLALGKLSRLVAPAFGAESLADGLVKAVELAKGPLDAAEGALPAKVQRALSASRSIRQVSRRGLEAFELTSFLQEHDKEGAWKGQLFFDKARPAPPTVDSLTGDKSVAAVLDPRSGNASVWLCQACLDGGKGIPARGSPAAGQGRRRMWCCG
ncbi:hypothetical protein KFL_001530170 [Klebsormidium nitens]|uniref:Uncharacterized protein n=1 Tax=Klebsormidium nitens TaxID=105231 RepID=A0A1Y1I4C3_KLENI|nr:hypothetical protein KFL_001530170 [Klebsormidium nitens]|eukprot:GAQ83576.1 hypothetical protein KFL_001530170 [Klebsormidium nitens]